MQWILVNNVWKLDDEKCILSVNQETLAKPFKKNEKQSDEWIKKMREEEKLKKLKISLTHT